MPVDNDAGSEPRGLHGREALGDPVAASHVQDPGSHRRWLTARFDPAWLVRALGWLPLRFNPLRSSARRDPYPHYSALREKAPVYYSPLFRGWVLTRHEDVASVLGDRRMSSNRRSARMLAAQSSKLARKCPELHRFSEQAILSQDPPEHTRLRKLVNKVFTPSVIRRLEPRIQEVIDSWIADALDRHSMEVVSDLAFPLPVTVIAEMLGVDATDAPPFRRWARALFSLTDPMAMFRADLRERAERSVGEMRGYFQHMAFARRRSPREDLLSALVAAEDQGKRLCDDELVAMCGAIVLAGHETTTNLIGNAMDCLLRFPEERERLIESPQLLASAIEEVVRFNGVSQLIMRIATSDIEIGRGMHRRVAKKGEMILLALAAANRDEEQFPDLDRFDVSRSPNRHLGFGLGAHFCLGASLARAETQLAVRSLLERLPDLPTVSVQTEWKPNPMLRGLARMQLTWS